MAAIYDFDDDSMQTHTHTQYTNPSWVVCFAH